MQQPQPQQALLQHGQLLPADAAGGLADQLASISLGQQQAPMQPSAVAYGGYYGEYAAVGPAQYAAGPAPHGYQMYQQEAGGLQYAPAQPMLGHSAALLQQQEHLLQGGLAYTPVMPPAGLLQGRVPQQPAVQMVGPGQQALLVGRQERPLHAGGVHQGMMPQGMMPQGMLPQGMQSQGMLPQGMQSQGMQSQGMLPQGMQNQGMQNQGMQNQGMQNQGMQNQGSSILLPAVQPMGGGGQGYAAAPAQQLQLASAGPAQVQSAGPAQVQGGVPAQVQGGGQGQQVLLQGSGSPSHPSSSMSHSSSSLRLPTPQELLSQEQPALQQPPQQPQQQPQQQPPQQ
jgi:hypothetical protein